MGKVTLNIRGIEVEVVPDKSVIDSESPICSWPLARAKFPLDENYVPGTTAGFFCSLCSAECILAPSGQAIYSVGKNPLICMDCALKMAKEDQ